MSRFDTWAAQNKRDRGQNDVQVDINLGAGDMVRAKDSKEKEYLELRAKITNKILIRMRELLNICSSRLEFYSRLDDDGISLMYLVALGITTEEDITSYRTMRKRGIDTYKLQEQAEGKRIDGAYLREIQAMQKELPTLKNIRGDDIQRTVMEVEKKDPVADKPKEESKKEPVRKYDPGVAATANSVDLDDELGDFETDVEEEQEDTHTEEEEMSWKSVLSSVKANNQQRERGALYEPEEEQTPDESKKRIVYIIADEFQPPYSEKYEFVFVKNSMSLGSFTSSKNNLLVVTSDVPNRVLNDFVNWISGMVASSDRYRITTLKNAPMRSPHIQEELPDLSDESLDAFYERHKNEEYIGDGVGLFYDLTSEIDDDYLLD